MARAPRSKKRKVATVPPATAADPAKTDLPKTTFMDLPVEIRCEIYGYVLEEEEPIKLRIQVRKKKSGPREIVRIYHSRDPKHRGEVYDKQARSWIPRPFTHSSILLTNRQINEEATPVLFASNRFSFETTTAVGDFMDLIGERGRHVRYVRVEIHGYKTTTASASFKALIAAKALRALEIDHTNLCCHFGNPKITPSRLAKDCKALLQSLVASYDALGLSGSVLSVLGVILSPCLYCRQTGDKDAHDREHVSTRLFKTCPCQCDQAHEKNAALQREIRATVAKYLGLEESGSTAPAG